MGVLCALSGIPQIGLSHHASSGIGIGIVLGLAAILLLRTTGAERSARALGPL